MKEQPAWVPGFTALGWEKVVIPVDLYRMLLAEYEKVKPGMEQELCIQAVINCQEVEDLGEESVLRSKRRTFMMQLRCSGCVLQIIYLPYHAVRRFLTHCETPCTL